MKHTEGSLDALKVAASASVSISELAAVQGGACTDCCCDLYSDDA